MVSLFLFFFFCLVHTPKSIWHQLIIRMLETPPSAFVTYSDGRYNALLRCCVSRLWRMRSCRVGNHLRLWGSCRRSKKLLHVHPRHPFVHHKR